MSTSKLADFLIQDRILTPNHLDIISQDKSPRGGGVAKIVLAMKLFSPKDLAQYIKSKTPYPMISDASNITFDHYIPIDPTLATYLEVIPLERVSPGAASFGMVDPLDSQIIQELMFFTDLKIKPIIIPLDLIYEALKREIPGWIPAPSTLELMLDILPKDRSPSIFMPKTGYHIHQMTKTKEKKKDIAPTETKNKTTNPIKSIHEEKKVAEPPLDTFLSDISFDQLPKDLDFEGDVPDESLKDLGPSFEPDPLEDFGISFSSSGPNEGTNEKKIQLVLGSLHMAKTKSGLMMLSSQTLNLDFFLKTLEEAFILKGVLAQNTQNSYRIIDAWGLLENEKQIFLPLCEHFIQGSYSSWASLHPLPPGIEAEENLEWIGLEESDYVLFFQCPMDIYQSTLVQNTLVQFLKKILPKSSLSEKINQDELKNFMSHSNF